jgi:thioredoxin reductase (NADPH)
MSTLEQCGELLDVAVVGAGPAGLGAGLYAARAGLRTMIFGDRYQSQLARAEIVENYPTQIEPLSGVELIEKLAQHAGKFGAQFHEDEVRQIKRERDRFHLFTAGGACFPAFTVILAMGTKRQQLGVPGEQEYYGRGVAYCTICDGPLFRGLPVAVIGRGEESTAAALRMSGIASHVDFILLAGTGLDDALREQVQTAGNVSLVEGAVVEEIVGDESGVAGVRVAVDGESRLIPVRGVFLEVGVLPASALAADLGVELDKDQFVRVGRNQETNVPGVFAAGDITGHRARQTVISAGEGATAAVSAVDYIKSNGLGGERKGLRLIQWGTMQKPSVREEPAPAAPPAPTPAPNALLDYVREEPAYQQAYAAYVPDDSLLQRVKALRPHALVKVVAASWCPDCRRNIPKLARISERLAGWEFRLVELGTPEAQALRVRAIPTIAVFDAESGRELGRIVEEPRYGSLEQDLLEIVSAEEKGEAVLFLET